MCTDTILRASILSISGTFRDYGILLIMYPWKVARFGIFVTTANRDDIFL